MSARAKLFCASEMTKLGIEICASDGDDRSVGLMSLFMKEVLLQLRKWLNGYTKRHELGRKIVEHYEMYELLAVVLFGDVSRISLEQALNALLRYGCIIPSAERVWFISHNIVKFPPKRGNDIGDRYGFKNVEISTA